MGGNVVVFRSRGLTEVELRERFEHVAAEWRVVAWHCFFSLRLLAAFHAWRLAREYDRLAEARR